MAKKPTTKESPPAKADPLQEAQARLKVATDRHAAVVSVLTRLSTSPQDKRMAQAESRKIDQEVRDAKRLLQEAQATARKQ